jgi:hypothetical protein
VIEKDLILWPGLYGYVVDWNCIRNETDFSAGVSIAKGDEEEEEKQSRERKFITRSRARLRTEQEKTVVSNLPTVPAYLRIAAPPSRLLGILYHLIVIHTYHLRESNHQEKTGDPYIGVRALFVSDLIDPPSATAERLTVLDP